jgi:hypothetical protein
MTECAVSVVRTLGADRGVSWRCIRLAYVLNLRGDLAALQAPMFDGLPSDHFAPLSDGFNQAARCLA